MACEAKDESPRFFVAVHVGAGYHAPSNEKSLRSAMKRACLAASSILRKVSLSLSLSLSPFASLESFQKLGVSFFYNIYIYIYAVSYVLCSFLGLGLWKMLGSCFRSYSSLRGMYVCMYVFFFFFFLVIVDFLIQYGNFGFQKD